MSAKALKFSNRSQNDFVQTLNSRVNAYFKDNNISRYANGAMVFKTLFHLTIWIGLYLAIMTNTFTNSPWLYAAWGVLGFFNAMVALNIGHDAIHGSYSKHKWINDLLSHTFTLNGASVYMWRKMHNVAHHTYTNIEGYDEDIESVPFIRMSPEKPLKPVHKYQHIFSFMVYGLATISWAFVKDYVKFFKNEVGNYNGADHPKKEYILLFVYKLLNYALFLAVPFIFLEQAWWITVIGLLIMHYTTGFTIAIIFMLAHVVEETHFPMPDAEGNLENSWAVHQLYTTADFSSDSHLAGFLSGGLNLQVEHHLFPNICHIHYKPLAKIVKKTAAEFGYPHYDGSFFHQVASHARFLKRMGREENYQPKPYEVAKAA